MQRQRYDDPPPPDRTGGALRARVRSVPFRVAVAVCAVVAIVLVGTSAYGAAPGDVAGAVASDQTNQSTPTGTSYAAVDGRLASGLSGSASPIDLTRWKLTLPYAGLNGTADSIVPAQLAEPYLVENPSGGLTFWAWPGGASTPNSVHARTELNSLDNFAAGSAQRTLTASVAVVQEAAGGQAVIIGQIHGADVNSSIPFVMLRYQAGTVDVIVKQGSGGSRVRFKLLQGVPLGASFDYALGDNGDGTMTLTASYGSKTVTKVVAMPEFFRGATVRFQAGAYGDDAKVTFFSLDRT